MDVKGFYTEIGGSYKDALAIMMNDMLISRMLAKFINGDSVPQMISQYEQKDYRALFASSHSLKGVAGNFGDTRRNTDHHQPRTVRKRTTAYGNSTLRN